MADIGLIIKDLGNNLQMIDIGLAGYDLTTDETLQTAVILSLFTDRRADPDDELPDGTADRRGWWAEALDGIEDDRIGSRLWLLAREKQTAEVANRAREYAEEALQWLVDDGVAAKVIVTTEWIAMGALGMLVEINKPDATKLTYKFDNIWEAITNGI
ncbi:MAG: phage GP46 family protein [Desulfobulbaceae bacterium]|nr:phage GP46 family protein [Desulfobulbaceae bacterium]